MEKNSDICREEIIYWNEYPTNDIEEYESENPMKNEFEPFVGQCFLISFFIKIMQINMVFVFGKVDISEKMEK